MGRGKECRERERWGDDEYLWQSWRWDSTGEKDNKGGRESLWTDKEGKWPTKQCNVHQTREFGPKKPSLPHFLDLSITKRFCIFLSFLLFQKGWFLFSWAKMHPNTCMIYIIDVNELFVTVKFLNLILCLMFIKIKFYLIKYKFLIWLIIFLK